MVIQEIFGVNDHIRGWPTDSPPPGSWPIAPALFDRVDAGVELDYDADGTGRGRDIAWNLP